MKTPRLFLALLTLGLPFSPALSQNFTGPISSSSDVAPGLFLKDVGGTQIKGGIFFKTLSISNPPPSSIVIDTTSSLFANKLLSGGAQNLLLFSAQESTGFTIYGRDDSALGAPASIESIVLRPQSIPSGGGAPTPASIKIDGRDVLTEADYGSPFVSVDSHHNVLGPNTQYNPNAFYGIAFGQDAIADKNYSVAIGFSANSSAPDGIALGSASYVNGYLGVALGGRAQAWSVASYSLGFSTVAFSPGQTVIGRFNAIVGDGGGNMNLALLNQNSPDRQIFIIGNGLTQDGLTGTRSNAFMVSETGDTWMSGRVRVAGGTTLAPSIFTGNVRFDGPVQLERQGDILMGEFGN